MTAKLAIVVLLSLGLGGCFAAMRPYDSPMEPDRSVGGVDLRPLRDGIRINAGTSGSPAIVWIPLAAGMAHPAEMDGPISHIAGHPAIRSDGRWMTLIDGRWYVYQPHDVP